MAPSSLGSLAQGSHGRAPLEKALPAVASSSLRSASPTRRPCSRRAVAPSHGAPCSPLGRCLLCSSAGCWTDLSIPSPAPLLFSSGSPRRSSTILSMGTNSLDAEPLLPIRPTPYAAPLSSRPAAVASKFPALSFSRREQQPRRLRAARCFVLRSEQHAVDARRVFAIFAQPHP
jgi:hypothetical protein